MKYTYRCHHSVSKIAEFTSLLEKYNSKELYEQFLQDTLTLLEDERPFFILDDSFRSKIYEVIGIYE